MKKVRCNKSDECRNDDCPHSKPHDPIPGCSQNGGSCSDGTEECEFVFGKVKCVEVR